MKTVYQLLFACSLFISISMSGFAQLYKVALNEKISKASLIVEGKVTAKKSFSDDAHTMIFTANTVKV